MLLLRRRLLPAFAPDATTQRHEVDSAMLLRDSYLATIFRCYHFEARCLQHATRCIRHYIRLLLAGAVCHYFLRCCYAAL